MALSVQQEAKPQLTQYFIRNDDIGSLTPALRKFIESFVACGIPVSYQIIPELLTSECAQYLRAVKSSHPDLIEFGQHGLRHRMSIGGRELKREFGPERSLADQTSDILAGRKILERLLGDEQEIALFTPPQHKFDRNTVTAAARAGHRVFSAACYPTLHHRLAYRAGRLLGLSSIRHHGISYHGRKRPEADVHEISISIAVDNGRQITCGPMQIDSALATAAVQTNLVGLMFHHEVYSRTPDQLDMIVQRLSRYPADRFGKLGAFANA